MEQAYRCFREQCRVSKWDAFTRVLSADTMSSKHQFCVRILLVSRRRLYFMFLCIQCEPIGIVTLIIHNPPANGQISFELDGILINAL